MPGRFNSIKLAHYERRRKYLKLVLLGIVIFMFLAYQTAFTYIPASMDSMEFYKELVEEEPDPLQACALPLYHPFEKEVLSYFTNPRPISCRSRMSVLTYMDDAGLLRFNDTAFSELGYSIEQLQCVYQEISRTEGRDDSVSFGPEIPMTGGERPESDFVFVACRRSYWLPKVYSMYHAYAQRRPQVRDFRDDEEVGVAVVGLDSVSRLNFMRQLPRSYLAITDTLGGVVLKGLNKVGENTFPNIVPILTGNPPMESPQYSTFDDWPFIWTPLGQDGVATLYAEDLSKIMTFSWQGDGFRSSPTTHYFRPFWIAVDSSALDAWSSPLCLGPVPKHRLYIEYLKSFLRTYRTSPLFMFSLENEPSHDYLNTVGIVDEDLEDFLLSSYKEGLFNRTVLLVLSDHGHRFDPFRNTKQGKIEDSMPMVSVVLPAWFSRRHPHLRRSLEANAGRLTSSYDLYSTFVDIFQQNSVSESPEEAVPYEFNKPSFGSTLFKPIALNRTCREAGVPEMYCVCKEDTQTLAPDDALAAASANVLMSYINDVVLQGNSELWNTSLQQYRARQSHFLNQTAEDTDLSVLRRCAVLSHTVAQADLVVKPGGRRLVHVTLEAQPSGGVFEGRVQWGAGEGAPGRVHQDIIRINRYLQQADCLPRLLMTLVPLVRSVCYCT